MKRLIAIVLISLMLLSGCRQIEDEEEMIASTYYQIDQETAKQMMHAEDGHIIVDVRRQDEYDAGHIPGAICIPNESISTEQPELLPDLNQIILVYCRSGRRSKEAAQKLFDIGYKNVYEFGGILDWTGEIVTEKVLTDSDNETEEEISESSDGAESIETGEAVMRLFIGEVEVPVTWEDNGSVQELMDMLPMTIQMTTYSSFEQVGPIPHIAAITSQDEEITTEPGDIVLYRSNQIVIFYGSNTWAYTRLGHVELDQSELEELLGNGDVEITITLDQ